MTQHRYRLSNQTSSRTLVSCYKAVQFTNSSSRSQHLAENEKRIAAHWCKWLLAAADRLLPASGREPFCSDLGREGRIFSLRLRCRNCKLVMKEYFQCLVKPWQLGNKRNCEKKENRPESIVLTGSSLTDYRGTVVSPVMGSRPRVGTAVSILSPSSIHYRASFGTARKPAVIWFRIL